MKTFFQTTKIDYLTINTIIKKPALLDIILCAEQIWYPEWKHFKVMKINKVFVLLDKNKIVFHSTCYGVVKMNLIERFHFYELSQKASKSGVPDG